MPVATSPSNRPYYAVTSEFSVIESDITVAQSGSVVVGLETERQIAEYLGGREFITFVCDPCQARPAQNTVSIAPCVACN